MFKILACTIIVFFSIAHAEDVVVCGSGENLVAAEQDALNKANLFAQDYVIVKKTNIAPPLAKNWQSSLTLRFDTQQYGFVVFTGVATTKEQARENAMIRSEIFFGTDFKIVEERYHGDFFIVCRLSVEPTMLLSSTQRQQGMRIYCGSGATKQQAKENALDKVKYLLGTHFRVIREDYEENTNISCRLTVEKISANRAWAFRDVGRSKQEARANALRRAILLLGKNIKVIKETYQGGGAFVICRLLVERAKRNVSLSPAQGIEWFTATDVEAQKAHAKAILLAKKLWEDEVTVYADTRVKLGNKWHCTVYAIPQTVTERDFTICGIGETQEQAYSNAQQALTIATPSNGKTYIPVKTIYQKRDNGWQCTIVSICK